MNMTKKIGAVALTAALALGGATAAVAADGSGGGSGSADRDALIAKVCEHKDEIVPRLTDVQTRVGERINTLEQRRQEALDAGHPRIANRIQRRLDRLHRIADRVANRLEQAPAWIAEHCAG
jgi:hypothetical protein